MSEEIRLRMDFETKKIEFMQFLRAEKERIETLRYSGSVNDFKYGEYITDEIGIIMRRYMEVYRDD